jgi:hypothetical protein
LEKDRVYCVDRPELRHVFRGRFPERMMPTEGGPNA